jgi:mono/diheme cytochrome c family protein
VAPEPGNLRRKKRTLILSALVVVFLLAAAAMVNSLTQWNAPAEARRVENPVPANESNLDEGMFQYQKHCQKCHGADGEGNGDRVGELSVTPTNFTDASRMRHLTDGELFWKITHGHRPMPAFADKLTETERWQAVDYIRTFANESRSSEP